MKKAILYSALALGSLSMTSCGDSFLELDPVGAVSEGTLTTTEGVDYLLTAAYSTFNNMTQAHWMGAASLSNYAFGDIAGADANKGSQSSDQSDLTQFEVYAINTSNSYVLGKWTAVYESVKRCNNVIDVAQKLGAAGTITAEEQASIEAQAKFIKAVWLFEGIRVFGAAIPDVTLEQYQASTDPQVSNVNESGSYVYIWSNVEQYLKEAIAGLPETWAKAESGRATSWMAKAELAKLYLYWSSPYDGKNATADHWNDCKALLDDIIANGQNARGTKYQLAENYADLWDADTSDWTGEDVFDVQLTISGTQTNTNAISYTPAIGQPGASGLGGWGFYQPTYEFVNSYIVDANGLPAADYQSREALTQMVGGNVESDLTTYTDPRLDVAAGRFGVPFLDYGVPVSTNGWVRDYTNGGLYMNKKNLPKIADRGATSVATAVSSSAKNFHVIRFADILLWRAEVAIHENDLATAVKYINQVRSRAANSVYVTKGNESYYENAGLTVPTGYTFDNKVKGTTVTNTVANYRLGLYTSFASAAEATTALKREYRAEFGMDGHRWFDLARWGEIVDVMNAYFTYEKVYLPKFTNVANVRYTYFPIPLTEIQTAEGRLVQNEAWK